MDWLQMICEILKCASNTSIFAIYHGEPFCGTLLGEANELLHIRDMFFPICISLSNQHIPTAMNMCGYFFGVHHIDPWEIMGETCLFVKHGRRHQKNMNLQQTLFGRYYRISLFSLCTHAFTDIHKNVWKRPLPVEWSCHHSTLIMKCNDLYALTPA